MQSDKFYEVSWASEPSQSQDQHGNRWQTLKFEGYGTNVQILAKNPVAQGQQLYGHITKEQKQAGGEYYRFRKQQIPEGVSAPAAGPNTGSHDMMALVKENNKMLKQLLGIEEAAPEPPQDTVIEDIDDNPVNLDDIPF